MTQVYLGLGSNIDRHKHIRAALDALQEAFGRLRISSVYESESVGFVGSDFFNLVVGVQTTLSVAELSEQLKQIEDDNERDRRGPRFSSRTLDIDILTYGDTVGREAGIVLPREEILENAFVLCPLAEIAPADHHPILKRSYSDLWRGYEKRKQKLAPVDFSWRGRVLSQAKR